MAEIRHNIFHREMHLVNQVRKKGGQIGTKGGKHTAAIGARMLPALSALHSLEP